MIYLKAFEAVLPSVVDFHLDVGTGGKFRFESLVHSKHSLYNDIDPALELISTPCFFGNNLLLSVFLKEKLFDLITCFDVIEHLKKEDGYKLIENLEKLSNKTIVFFTPIGDIAIGQSKIQYHVHLSGWKPEEFAKLGYQCWVFPNFHKRFGYGAFFAIKTTDQIEKKKIEGIDDIFKGEHWL